MADDNSVLFPFSALKVHKNTELNPDAPEYNPVLHHHHSTTTNTTTSAFFYFQPRPYLPPPLPAAYTLFPPTYYFQPLIHLTPQTRFTHIVPHPPPRNLLTWSQPCVDQVQGSDDIERDGIISSGNGSRRCWGVGWRRRVGARVWRPVKSGQRSSTTEPISRRRMESRSSENRVTMTSSSVKEGEWRTVKYRACKKYGKKFKIQPVEESAKKTTVMIRNIPSRYTREMMLTFLDRHCMEVNQKVKQSCSSTDDGCCISAYDFFYMPMDFKTGMNKSYAFVNFTTPEAVWRFHTKCDDQKWDLFESNKIRQIALAKLQGTGELIEHFGRTAFACDRDEFLPVYFQPPRDGRADVDRMTSIIGKRVS